MGVQAAELLRERLLDGVAVALAAAPAARVDSAAARFRDAATGLGARLAELTLAAGGDAEADERGARTAMSGAIRELGSLDALVVDAGGLFAASGGRESLMGSLAASWNAVRAAATVALIESGGRVVLLAPPAGGEHSAAAAAGLENMARTLSIEWARYAITTVAVAPGEGTGAEELATLTCWLLSPAGAYFSGCVMDLRGPRTA